MINAEITTISSDTEAYMEDFLERTRIMYKLPLSELPHIEVRLEQVKAMTDEYEEVTGRDPDGLALHRLANYLLAGHLKDPSPDKITQNEYPVLSRYQLRRRMRTQIAMETDTMDFLQSKIHRRMDSLARTTVPKAVY